MGSSSSKGFEPPDKDEERLREIWEKLDDNNDGIIDAEHLAVLFESFGAPILNIESVQNLMRRTLEKRKENMAFRVADDEDDAIDDAIVVDAADNRNVVFTWEDFSECFLAALRAFREIDSDDNGKIDVTELQYALYINSLSLESNLSLFNVEQIDAAELIRRFDIRHDGVLDFAEFFLLYDLASQTRLENILSFLVTSSCVFSDSPFIVQRPAQLSTSFFCGAFAGAVARTATAPLSRLILLAQVSTGSDSLMTFSKRILVKEGISGFWRGNLATVAKIAPSVAINLTVYDELNPLVSRMGMDPTSSLAVIFKGAMAGCISTAATYPMDSIRTVLSLEGAKKSFSQAVREIGAKNLFNGLGLAISEVVPNMAVRYYLFEKAKQEFIKNLHTQTPTYSSIIAASAIAACISQALTYPLVVIRRNQQTTGLKAWQALKRIKRKFGFKGFYRGIGANLVQIVPSVAIGFGGYEILKNKLSNN